jgi:hypothetical protein
MHLPKDAYPHGRYEKQLTLSARPLRGLVRYPPLANSEQNQ